MESVYQVKTEPVAIPGSTAVNDTDLDNALSKAKHNGIPAPMRAYLQGNNNLPS